MSQAVRAFAVHDAGLGGGTSLIVGGLFGFAGDQSAQRVTRLAGCASARLGDQDGDGDIDGLDLQSLLDAWGACPDPPAACPGDLDGDGSISTADLLALLEEWT